MGDCMSLVLMEVAAAVKDACRLPFTRGYANAQGMRGLYAIVDPDFCNGRDPVAVSRRILVAGGRILQLRCKDTPDQQVLEWARAIAALKRQFAFTFIINDRLEIALAAGADGLHIGQGDMPALAARAALGAGRLLGLSTHTQAQVHAANALPVDYIGFGAVFKTATKAADHPVPGPSGLAEAVSGACHPVVAIGGITVETVEAVKAAGASAYAVLSAITQAADIETVVGNLLSRFFQI